jgi:nitrilase
MIMRKETQDMMQTNDAERLTLGMAQIAPVWLNRDQTLAKILAYAHEAAEKGCDLVVFGEGLLPGYPFWLERTHGAEFNSPRQKEIHAHYLANAVQIEAGHLEDLCDLARENHLAVYLGCIERPDDRGGHSVYASLIYIDPQGEIQSVHRKLMPTYEERLTWSPGDGHGLRTHRLGAFTVGGLNVGRIGCRSRGPHSTGWVKIYISPSGQAARATPGTSPASSPSNRVLTWFQFQA